MSEYVEVMGADFRNGLLAIRLEVIIPDSQRPRKVEINMTQTLSPQLLNEENLNATDKGIHG
jgi:molecular chaperone IbpA